MGREAHQLGAMSADAVVGIDQRHALAFDRQRGRDLFERAWLARFRALIESGLRMALPCQSLPE